jgi:uncharacterized protein YecE (DUF72 family)
VARTSAFVGSAGWNIPRAHRDRFSADGAQLQRYASRLNAVEINTSFYRRHAIETYARWAAAVPPAFRFAVKMPRTITHDRALLRVREPLEHFLGEIRGLGRKLGPLLVQLPPSFAFDAPRVGRFFELLRARHAGTVVCEPRHATWTTADAEQLLASYGVSRVAADPPRAAGLGTPGGFRSVVYYRWHGSPRPYFSPYDEAELDRLAAAIEAHRGDAWCIFDNTGSGAAAGNALDLTVRLALDRNRRERAAASASRVAPSAIGRRRR